MPELGADRPRFSALGEGAAAWESRTPAGRRASRAEPPAVPVMMSRRPRCRRCGRSRARAGRRRCCRSCRRWCSGSRWTGRARTAARLPGPLLTAVLHDARIDHGGAVSGSDQVDGGEVAPDVDHEPGPTALPAHEVPAPRIVSGTPACGRRHERASSLGAIAGWATTWADPVQRGVGQVQPASGRGVDDPRGAEPVRTRLRGGAVAAIHRLVCHRRRRLPARAQRGEVGGVDPSTKTPGSTELRCSAAACSTAPCRLGQRA